MLSNAGVRVPANRAPSPPPPRRRLAAIALSGGAAALLVLAIGFVSEMAVLGQNEQASRARVQEEVRASFDAMSRNLRDVAIGMADIEAVSAASADDTTATRRLFDAAEAALGPAVDDELAITVYAADGQPLAWAGRPSDLPTDRLGGPEAWFFAQGALGLRLVYVTPLTTDAAVRIGSVAAERALSPIVTDAEDAFIFPTRFSRVSLQLNFETTGTTASGDAFDVATPTGGRLLTATLTSEDLARARERWRTATRSLAIVTLAIVLVLLCGPLLEWRNVTQQPRDYVAVVLLIIAGIVAARALMTRASLADWSAASLFSATAYASSLLAPLLRSPFDLLATAVVLGSIVSLCLFGVEAWRVSRRHRRLALDSALRRTAYVLTNLAAGVALAFLFEAHLAFLRDTIANATVDLLHFSLHPWSTARVALEVGLVIFHASVAGTGVLL